MFNTESKIIKQDVTRLDYETMLRSAIAQRDRLLMLRPKLKALQNDIDTGLSRAKSLNEKFEYIGIANANYKNRAEA